MLTLPHPQACQLAAELLQPERALTVVVGQADALPAWKCDFTQAETVSAEALF